MPHTLHHITPIYLTPILHSLRNAAAAKSNAVFNTQLCLSLHLCALPVWQYTLNASQPSMNQQTVSGLPYRSSARPQRLLRRTTKYLLAHKMTHCSTYTTPDLPPTLAPRLALCKAIHSNKYRQPNPPNQLPTYHFASFLNTTHTQ